MLYYYYFIISTTPTSTVAVVAAEKCGFIIQILLMRSTSIIYNLYHFHSNRIALGFVHRAGPTTRRVRGPKLKFITKCINNNDSSSSSSSNSSSSNNSRSNNSRKIKKKRKWWQEFFFDDEGNWLFLKDDDMILEDNYDDMDTYISSTSTEAKDEESQKFEAWKRRAEAITELREAQEDIRNEENRRWEDWLQVNDMSSKESNNGEDASSSSWDFNNNNNNNSNGFVKKSIEDARADPTSELIPERGGLVKSLRDLVLGKEEEEDDDLLYEDRVFSYASLNSAKFLAVLVIIPWAMDFLVHDYVLLPFLDRYVKTVPLAAELLDVRRHQKLEMVKELNTLKARFRLEVEIGKSPPLSDEETWLELRHKALELRDEWRLENRKAFANIWSDMVFGITLFLLLYFNQNQVALLKFTGYKIVNNISDTGKALLIILITDIFLGYHSESGWQTLLEILVDHYGLVVDEAAITLFVCLVPVVIDACVKLWLFKYLPRLSPRVSNIFREMKRH